MIRICTLCLLLACLVTGCEPKPERLTTDAAARSPEGWRGRRYMQDGRVISEEFDTTGNGRMDRWRYYAHGRLILEEFDESGHGRVNRRERHLDNGHIQVEVDSNHDGRMDRWVQFNDKGVPVMYGLDHTGDGRVNEWLPMPGVSRTGADPTTPTPPPPPPASDAEPWRTTETEMFHHVEERGFEQREFQDPEPRPYIEVEDMSLPPYGESDWETSTPVPPDATREMMEMPIPEPEAWEEAGIPEEPRLDEIQPVSPEPPRTQTPPTRPAPPSRYPGRHPSEGLEE